MWQQDRKFKSESLAYISKRGIPLHKIQITNNTNDEKKMSLAYNYKLWYKLISMHWFIPFCSKK